MCAPLEPRAGTPAAPICDDRTLALRYVCHFADRLHSLGRQLASPQGGAPKPRNPRHFDWIRGLPFRFLPLRAFHWFSALGIWIETERT